MQTKKHFKWLILDIKYGLNRDYICASLNTIVLHLKIALVYVVRWLNSSFLLCLVPFIYIFFCLSPFYSCHPPDQSSSSPSHFFLLNQEIFLIINYQDENLGKNYLIKQTAPCRQPFAFYALILYKKIYFLPINFPD